MTMTRPSLSSLRVRLLLLVLLGAIPAVSLTVRTTLEWRRYQVHEVREEAIALAKFVAEAEEHALAVGRERLAGLSQFPSERFRDPAECRRLLSAQWSSVALYETLGVAGADGQVLCAIDGPDDTARSGTSSEHPAAMSAEAVRAEDRIDARPGKATMVLTHALAPGGTPSAPVAFARVDVGRLGSAGWPNEADGRPIMLIDANGTILARQPDPARWVGQSALGLLRSIAAKRDEGTVEAADLDGVRRRFAFRAVAGWSGGGPLYVVVGIEPGIAFADGDHIIRRRFVELAVVAGLALAAAWIGTDVLLVRRTKALVATARRLAMGDLSARTGMRRGSGELAELSRAFDEMAAALEARQAETERARAALRAAHQELEDRVRSRTAELVDANAALERALSERERAEEALRKLSSAVEQAADSVMIANRDGVIEYVNPAFERLTGYRAAEAIGHTGRILKSGAHEAAFYRELWQAITAGDVFRAVFVNRKKNGEHYDEEKIITPLRDAHGAISHFVAAGRDITERKEAEEQLRTSREELRALAAHLESVREDERTRIAREIHDELGQALTALRFDVRALDAKSRDERAMRPDEITRMTGLIDRTIASVRRIATELRPGVLDDLGLAAAIEWQAHEFETRTGIRCEVSMTANDLEADRDVSTVVFRIFQETLINVARHAGASRVDVALTFDESGVTLVMRDDGRGISEAEIAGQRSLGLVGMRERAQLHGGRLAISGRPGDGTTVVLGVPLSRSPAH
jgi:PAS domain S-box-containing protein